VPPQGYRSLVIGATSLFATARIVASDELQVELKNLTDATK
jgi:hypothetical protein